MELIAIDNFRSSQLFLKTAVHCDLKKFKAASCSRNSSTLRLDDLTTQQIVQECC